MFSFPGQLEVLIPPFLPLQNDFGVYTSAEPVALKMAILRSGDEVHCERLSSRTAAFP